MTPHTLTLRGSIGIRAGLGRDEITLDLDGLLPADARVVAIRGDNGSGKSTLINLAMTPWLNPPMLAGNIYDHFGESGERILEWSHHGHRYRSQITYRQTPKTKTTRATLHVLLEDGWAPVTLPDHTVSDGKTSTYEACLLHILGPQSVYYLAAFQAQDTPALSDYDDPKGLMRDLLHLDAPAKLSESARSVARELRREYEAIRDKANDLQAASESAASLEASIGIESGLSPRLNEIQSEAQTAHARARAELEEAMTKELDVERIREARGAVETRIAARRTALQRETEQYQESTLTITTQIDHTIADAKRQRQLLIAQRLEAEQRQRSARALIDRAEQIRDAAKKLQKCQSIRAANETRIHDLRILVEHKRKVAIELTDLKHTVNSVLSEWRTLSEHVVDLEERAGYVDQVPCQGQGVYADCPALKDAIDAAAKAIEARELVEHKKQAHEERKSELDTKTSLLDELGHPEDDLDEAENERRRLDQDIERHRGLAVKLDQLETAEQSLTDEMAAVERIRTHLAEIDSGEHQRLEALRSKLAEINVQINLAKSSAEEDILELNAELNALPMPDTENIIDHARQRVAAADQALRDAQHAVQRTVAVIEQMRAQLAALRKEIDLGSVIAEKAKRLEDEIAHWTLLAIALRGIVDLSIEDAGPGIAEIANRLLREAYGPRFTLKIVTQREQQNGKLVECFDVIVIDGASGIASSIVHKSGGESVWLNKAITDAVGVYHQDAAGVNFETLFADEAEDGLTAERKQMFYRMDRAAMDIGGYGRKIFISHNPDAWNLADAVIDMEMLRAA